MSTDLADLVSLERPVVQAAMGGGVSGSKLAIAVSKAGGLGSLGHAAIDVFRAELDTSKKQLGVLPYSANLLMPLATKAHIEACLSMRVPVVSVFYGYRKGLIAALKDAGCRVSYQVGSLEEAERVVAEGVDFLIVQGVEGGGHLRGNKPLTELLPAIRERHSDVPLVAAGGVHDADTARKAVALGADGVAAGTRFLMSEESGAHSAYKLRLVQSTKTIVTTLFGLGWHAPHRVIENAATRKWANRDGDPPAWTVPVNRACESFARYIPAGASDAMFRSQKLWLPLYSPVTPNDSMTDPPLECSALYAGECVADMDSVEGAASIVGEIGTAFQGSGSGEHA